ncbi:MAG: DUF177 domain-containing protein [Actinomycetota bacterium]|nr:DUF177 domain-containing protein [Actinomycetota bacterium]
MTATPNSDFPLCFDLPKLFQKAGSASLSVDWYLEDLSTTYSKAQHLGGELRAETSGEKVLISGELLLGWEGPCRRCLEITSGVFEVEISEVYEQDPTEGETFRIPSTHTLDLKPMLSEQILLSLPLTPLCSSDCQGPIPEEYPANSAQEEQQKSGNTEQIDPRWEVLGDLIFDEKEGI